MMTRRTTRRRRPALESLEGRTLLSAGDLDTPFGGTGFVTRDLGTTSDQARAVAVQPWDGKLVVAASTGQGNFTLTRFNPDGSPDDGSAGDSTPGDKFGTG